MTRTNSKTANASTSGNAAVDEELKTPPPASKRGTSRGRGSARGGRGNRGRGRGTLSAEASPVLGPRNAEDEHVNVDDGDEVDIEVEEYLTDGELALDEEGLAQAIAAEERKGCLLEQQKRLATLKRDNFRKSQELKKARAGSARQGQGQGQVVFNELEETVSNLPSLNESAGRALPTLSEVAIQEEVPSLSTLRGRPTLQREVEQQMTDLDPWRLQGAGNTFINPGVQQQGTGRFQSGRVAKTDSGVVRLIVWPHTRVFSKLGATISFEKLDLASLVVGEAYHHQRQYNF